MPAFYLQHPTASLLALLSLLVPVAIYLWNRRPGRVVQVGSLRWLEAAANRRLRSLKPEGLPLLLVRIAILGLLALALAEPSWRSPAPARRGQILLSPAASPEAVRSLRPTLDSLLRRGYELRELRPGLPIIAPEAQQARLAGQMATAPDTDTLAALGHSDTDNTWAQVQQAADSFPNRPLVVVAPLLLHNFRGTRPTLPANVSWRPTPTATDSVVEVVAAWQPRPDSLLLLLAHGTETGTSFRRVRLGHPASGSALRVLPAPAEVRYQEVAGKATLQIKNPGGLRTVSVQTGPSHYWISYDASHAADARVLRAALQAAGSVAPVAPRLTVSTALPTSSDSLAWLFWLRAEPVPTEWQQRVRKGLHLWQEAAGPGAPAATHVAWAESAPVQIQRHDTLPVPRLGWALWQDAQGGSLLSAQPLGQGRLYHLHTRLTQPWSGLADSPELPAQLLPLLWPSATAGSALPDLRVLDPAQVLVSPTSLAASTSAIPLPTERGPVHDYTPWLVLAAGILFGLERWLAARRSAHSVPASV
ncbi:BatA domain-containing protein [Hymenobacter fodinae]|uniref:BatA domain-containing protein n=1 Tax=Hymenobacter fodinae TaxID=2510796 RepID=UPI001436C400|nr:BatA domain-containing protein [Hymenobacter fodinae]